MHTQHFIVKIKSNLTMYRSMSTDRNMKTSQRVYIFILAPAGVLLFDLSYETFLVLSFPISPMLCLLCVCCQVYCIQWEDERLRQSLRLRGQSVPSRGQLHGKKWRRRALQCSSTSCCPLDGDPPPYKPSASHLHLHRAVNQMQRQVTGFILWQWLKTTPLCLVVQLHYVYRWAKTKDTKTWWLERTFFPGFSWATALKLHFGRNKTTNNLL